MSEVRHKAFGSRHLERKFQITSTNQSSKVGEREREMRPDYAAVSESVIRSFIQLSGRVTNRTEPAEFWPFCELN